MKNKWIAILVKSGIITMCFFILFLIFIFIWLLHISPGTTAPIVDAKGRKIPGSVAEAQDISIGGIKQFITVRGHSKEDPLLLILHGGPGDAEGHLFRTYNKVLEKHFLVANWDQRGAGRSYSRSISDESMTFEQFISDAEEVTSYLKKRFHKEKIILLGHSWGAFMAVHLAHKNPQDYYAVATIGLAADQVKGEEYSYNALLEQANKKGDKKTVSILTKLGPPVNGKYSNGVEGIVQQRQIMMQYGGTAWGKDKWGLISLLFKPLLTAREYRLKDKINWTKGGAYAGPLLFHRLMEKPLIKEVPELQMPFYLFQGKKDLNTPYPMAKQYFSELSAPHKEMFTFENSAHFLPFNQEKEKFNNLMINRVRTEAHKESNALAQ